MKKAFLMFSILTCSSVVVAKKSCKPCALKKAARKKRREERRCNKLSGCLQKQIDALNAHEADTVALLKNDDFKQFFEQ